MPTPPAQSEYVRYCPGEERIKISDAVCLGRRRVNYFKCKGCQFNDDEKKAGPASLLLGDRSAQQAEELKREKIATLFKAYDVRGVYPDPLDEDAAWRIGYATAQFLRSELRGYDRSRSRLSAIVVGRDMRKSSPALTEALIEGVQAGGSPVINIGMIDTPQLYFAVNHLTCCGGIVTTASHNPGHYNGFKICGQKGRPVSADTGLTKILRIAQNMVRHTPVQMPGVEEVDLTEPYKAFVRGFLKRGASYGPHRPLRVVVDASNGMAGRWLPLLFGDIDWLDIVRLNFEHNGDFIHDPDPLVEKNLTQLKDRVLRAKADLGFCFDGDADRCIVVDSKGQTVRSDWMTVLLARHLLKKSAGSAIIYDLRSSRVVAEEVRKAGGYPRRERCGHSIIKKSLADAKGLFAGELSGHFYFRDNWYCDSGMIAFAEIINIVSDASKPLCDLVAPLKRYANSGELSFRNENPSGTIGHLAEKYRDGEVDFLDGVTIQYPDWWFNVRPSNTEPYLRLNLEAKDAELMKARLAELMPMLGTPVDR